MENNEKPYGIRSNRGNRHKRLYKKALARSRFKDFAFIAIIGTGTAFWTGVKSFRDFVSYEINSESSIIELKHRFDKHEDQHILYNQRIDDHEERIRELEKRRK